MFSIFKNDSSSSSSAATNNIITPRTVSKFDWVKIYNREGTSSQNTVVQSDIVAPVATVNMQSSRSTGNLDQLGCGIKEMDLNARTATSTPVVNMPGEFQDPGVHPNHTTETSRQSNSDRDRAANSERAMIINPQMDDDVFGVAAIEEVQQPVQSREEVSVALPVITPVAPAMTTNDTPTPRADRLAEPLTTHNAQGLLTPDSLLFVANLPSDRPDQELAAIVHEAFVGFGFNVVKVRRDKHQNPFALVQFDNAESAHKALEGSQNMVVGGRKVRTEVAEARRSVILYKIDGTTLSYQEVHYVLGSYGHIEEVKPTTHADATQFGVPIGFWVKFSFYLDYKDLLSHFNHYNGTYFIMDAPNANTPQRGPIVPAAGYDSYSPNTPRSSTDTRSVFVGNLPFNVNESELANTFGRFGVVRLVTIIRKSIGGQGFNTFAFIEFSNIHEANAAAQAEVDLRGKRIRVEPKEYSIRRAPRSYGRLPPAQGYRPVPWGPPAQSLQPPIPYGPQPIMGNQGYGPVTPYNGGAPWNTPPPSTYQTRAFPPDHQFFNGSPNAPRQMAGPYGPLGTPTHGFHDPQAYAGAQAYGGPPPFPQGPRPAIVQVAHMGSMAPRPGAETGGNSFGPPQQQQ